MIRQFWDERHNGFFFTGKENEWLIAQSKHPYDNVLPSSNSVAVFNLVRLGYLTGEEALKKRAEEILHLFYALLLEHPSGFSNMVSGLSFFFDPEEIGVIGSGNDPRTKAMLKQINASYLPNKILSVRDPGEPMDEKWLPFLRDKGMGDVPLTFVCKGFTCLPPAKDEKDLEKILA